MTRRCGCGGSLRASCCARCARRSAPAMTARSLRWPWRPTAAGSRRGDGTPPDKALGGDFVYIFQASTGAMITRLGPLDNVILHLAVSPDGRYLAATLFGGQGLRVWERTADGVATWRLVLDDRDYGGQRAMGAAFDRDGALYTVAYDGKLRRYAPGFQGRPSIGRDPRGQAALLGRSASRRTTTLRLGYEDTSAVEVYDAATLGLALCSRYDEREQRQSWQGRLVRRRRTSLRRRQVQPCRRRRRPLPHPRLGPGRQGACASSRDRKILSCTCCLRRRHCHGRGRSGLRASGSRRAPRQPGRRVCRPTFASTDPASPLRPTAAAYAFLLSNRQRPRLVRPRLRTARRCAGSDRAILRSRIPRASLSPTGSTIATPSSAARRSGWSD